MSFIEIIVFVFNTLVIVHFNVHNMKMMCQIPNKKKKFQVNVTLCNVKCGNHGDDSGIECSDDIHNTYCMACVDNKLVGCSWICSFRLLLSCKHFNYHKLRIVSIFGCDD